MQQVPREFPANPYPQGPSRAEHVCVGKGDANCVIVGDGLGRSVGRDRDCEKLSFFPMLIPNKSVAMIVRAKIK